MGWNTVSRAAGFGAVRRARRHAVLLRALLRAARWTDADPLHAGAQVTVAEHGEPFVAAVENGPLSATQFHPEKSGDAGAAAACQLAGGPVSELILLPAVDVADGQAVRLVQGEAGSETSYGDPLDGRAGLAARRAPSGCTWSTSTPRSAAASNRELLAEVVGALDVDGRAVRRHPRRRVAGRARWPPAARRVNLGTAALEYAGVVRARRSREHGDRIAVGLDVRGTTLAARGWTQEGGELLRDARPARRRRLRPLRRHRRRPRTARCAGPNLDLLRERLRRAPTAPVVACGRVSLARRPARARRRSCPVGVEGAIVGKALYAGRVHAARGAAR